MPEISSPHKTTHQNGGEDEINVAGLSGTLADDQTPSAHASSHEVAGADEVEFLKLTDRKHAAKHQNTGDDEISVAGLSGELADSQPPKAHASSHADGAADSIDASTLDKMLKIVPCNAKIADIKEADTNKHTLDLATALGETRKIIEVTVSGVRITGTGAIFMYPNEGADGFSFGHGWSYNQQIAIKDGTQRLQYNQDVANDDWDIYCWGYMVEA